VRKTIKLLIIICALHLPSIVLGQKGAFSANVGFGLIQGYLLGVNYNYTQNLKLGIDIGSHLGLASSLDETLYSLAIENDLQFGKINRFGFKPWYFAQQIMYWVKDMSSATVKTLSITPTLGVMLAISESFGISCEFGPALNLTLDIDRKTLDEQIYNWPVFPSGKVQLVYSF
jgi:hypothetical protein